jgi:hypothetical protein
MKKIIPLLFALPFLPGCIAWEIRDEVRSTNQHLCEVKPALVHTLHAVEETNQKIALTQEQLAAMQAEIVKTQAMLTTVEAAMRQTDEHLVAVGGTLGATNPTLVELDGGLERMKVLNEVHASLKSTNEALGPLGKAMGSLGGAMSLLGMGGDSGPDLLADDQGAGGKADTDVAAAEPDAAGKGAGGTGNVGSGGGGEGDKRPDPLLGTWVRVYPPPAPVVAGSTAAPQSTARITVVTADGKFLTAEGGQPPRTGRWERKGRMLTFTYDAAAGAKPEVDTAELLTLNSRTMTVRRGDMIAVHSRP